MSNLFKKYRKLHWTSRLVLTFFILNVLYFASYVVISYLVGNKIQLDQTDKANIVQIALLSGLVETIIAASKLYLQNQNLIKIEHLPILSLHVDRKKARKTDEFGEILEYSGQYLSIRNSGKGNAFNVKVDKILNNESKENKLHIEKYSNKFIETKSSIHIQIKEKISLKDLTNCQFIIEVQNVNNQKTFWRFNIRDAEKGYIELMKWSNSEQEVWE